MHKSRVLVFVLFKCVDPFYSHCKCQNAHEVLKEKNVREINGPQLILVGETMQWTDLKYIHPCDCIFLHDKIAPLIIIQLKLSWVWDTLCMSNIPCLVQIFGRCYMALGLGHGYQVLLIYDYTGMYIFQIKGSRRGDKIINPMAHLAWWSGYTPNR